MKQPKVSVVMITYGHEKFIEEAINSVLMQKCDFDVELIIADDCSPDNTEQIVKSFEKSHPKYHWIKYTKHNVNKGMMPNFIWALNETKGKFVALCEGDDYWTDPLKLQKQVEFLETNEDYSMCFHAVEITRASENDFFEYPIPKSSTLKTWDIISDHFIPTCSLVFANKYFKEGYPKWLSTTISGDIPLEMILSSKGKAKYFSEKMACYRRNLGSVTQQKISSFKIRSGYINMYLKIAAEMKWQYKLYLYMRVIKLKLGYIKKYLSK